MRVKGLAILGFGLDLRMSWSRLGAGLEEAGLSAARQVQAPASSVSTSFSLSPCQVDASLFQVFGQCDVSLVNLVGFRTTTKTDPWACLRGNI